MTTTGAALAGPAAVDLEPTPLTMALAQSQVSESIEDSNSLAQRQADTARQTAVLQGRQQEDDRIAREAVRESLAQRQAQQAEIRAQQEARRAEQRWVLPMDEYRFTSQYGQRWGRLHAGIDLAAPIGTPVRSISSGVVVKTYYGGGCGREVTISHWDGTASRYCHLDRFLVEEGQRVSPGQEIARSGNTGHSTGPHLHFEIFPGGPGSAQVDPVIWLAGKDLAFNR